MVYCYLCRLFWSSVDLRDLWSLLGVLLGLVLLLRVNLFTMDMRLGTLLKECYLLCLVIYVLFQLLLFNNSIKITSLFLHEHITLHLFQI